MVQIANSLFSAAVLVAGAANALPYGSTYGTGYSYSSVASEDYDNSYSTYDSSYSTDVTYDTDTSYSTDYSYNTDTDYSTDTSYNAYTTSVATYDSTYTTTAAYDYSSSYVYEYDTSTVLATSTYLSVATSDQYYTSTYSSDSSYSTQYYGSGSSSWSDSSYDSCVQQCVASYGAPSLTYTATATYSTSTSYSGSGDSSNSGSSGDSSYSGSSSDSSSYSGSSGTGATHTVIVAPTQGVLRYVPFATNASVGDTIMFIWGAGPHTVTKSSELAICNKTDDAPFASGSQNESFVFTQVVNDTDPTFFYCGIPTHCEQGMFGIINAPNADTDSSSSLSSMMPAIVANNSDMSTYVAYANNMTSAYPAAQSYGTNIDMSNMPDWAMQYVAENALYSQMFIAANPAVMQADGTINLGAVPMSEMVIPKDLSAALSTSSSSASSSGAPASSPSGSAAPASNASKSNSGVRGVASSTAVTGIVAVAVAFFML